MAEAVEVTINGIKTKVPAESTILDVCRSLNVEIPTLCHDDRLKNYGGCRLCLVEVEGGGKPVVACSTSVSQDMAVTTESDKLFKYRKVILEFILSDHPNDCMTCQSAGDCQLQDLAYEFGIKENRFPGERRKIEPETVNPFIIRDYEKCILCNKCVRACDEIMGIGAIDIMGRGFNAKIATPYDLPLDCIFCGQCIEVCPVGALREKSSEGKGRQAETVKTICPYCGVGCGINLHIKNNKIIKVTPVSDNPSNNGVLCVKGKFGLEFVNSPERLKKPLLRKNGELTEVEWDEALQYTADKLSGIKAEHGPDSIGGLCSAKCTNEDNYLLQRFMRATIGTNNVDHCARLCHAPSATGLIMAFGSGAMTNSTDDMLKAKTVLIIGSNTTETHPVSFLKLLKSIRERGCKLIVIDPRKTRLTSYADVWLDLKPGTNVAVLNGLMNVILREELLDRKFIEGRTEGFDEFETSLLEYDPKRVEAISGVDSNKLIEAARLYAKSGASAIYYGMGVTQHTQGTENVLLLAALSMMTGNIGRPGTGVNPLRGQSNVQGACDMGALPNLFPGYASVANDEQAERFEKLWNAGLSRKPGLTSTEMVEVMETKEIRALYVMGENPLLSDPNLNHARKAFASLDLLIVQDIFLSETAKQAHVVFPSASFAEKNGTFINTDRRVQMVNKVIQSPGEARDDSRIIMDLSKRMGHDMDFSCASDIWDEIGSIWPAVAGISYSRIKDNGIQWPCPDKSHPGTQYLYGDSFARGLGKFFPAGYIDSAEMPDAQYPLTLSTGRILFHFHTGTMSRRVAALNEHTPEGFAYINSEDAKKCGIGDSDMVKVTSRRGNITIKANVSSDNRKGMVFIPFHFAEAAANLLTINALEKYSKIPSYKVCAIKIENGG